MRCGVRGLSQLVQLYTGAQINLYLTYATTLRLCSNGLLVYLTRNTAT
jgi:hypothetical protein